MIAPALIVDAHVHTGSDRYEPLEVLRAHMALAGVHGAVLIQHHSQLDNTYLLECVQRYPDTFAAVMRVPPDDDGRAVHIWAKRGFVGLRLRAWSRSPGADPLAQWRAAAELGLTVSVYGTPAEFASDTFAEAIAAFPRLPLVLEHLGGADAANRPPTDAYAPVFALAVHANVFLKVPGWGELTNPPVPFVERATPAALLDAALAAFGPERLLWGSDWPLCCAREGYANALREPLEHFAALPPGARAAIFGGNARRLWPVAEATA